MREQNDILKLPINYLRYLNWHKQSEQKNKRVSSNLFGISYPRPRFEFTDDDIPKLTIGLQLKAIGSYTLVYSEYGETVLELDYGVLSSMLDLINGSKVHELISRAIKHNLEIDVEIVNKLIGIAIIAPDTIEDLELAVPGISIVRIPFSPYQIVRNYWKNMIEVRKEIEIDLFKKNSDVLEQIKRLHITTLMGSNLRTFYKPDSGVSDISIWPGHFRNNETGVSYGGEEFSVYMHIVAYSLDITIKDSWEVNWNDCGQYWGKGFVFDHITYYYPPDAPFSSQLDQLCTLLMALPSKVDHIELPKALSNVAKFHQRFIQLHPFECANQSLAMCIVNHFLQKWIGSCIPHLQLDMVAFFLSPENYSRYFARAIKYYAVKTVDAQLSYSDFKNRFERIRQNFPILALHYQSKSIDNFLEENPDVAADLLLLD